MEKEIINKKCRKCGNVYNNELKRCPNCGEPNSIIFIVLRWIKIIIHSLILITILIASIVNSIKLVQINEKIEAINSNHEYSDNVGVEIMDLDFYDTYEIKDSKLPENEEYFLYFHQKSCEFCLEANKHIVSYYMTPTTPDANEFIYDEIPIYFVTPDSSYDLFEKYEIEGTPTLIHFKNGENIEKVVGGDEVFRLLDEIVSRYYK